jgi:hypothetical protein
MPSLKSLTSAFCFCLLLTLCAVSAKADTTYTYTGPQFNDFLAGNFDGERSVRRVAISLGRLRWQRPFRRMRMGW